jgi:hypothetical protein
MGHTSDHVTQVIGLLGLATINTNWNRTQSYRCNILHDATGRGRTESTPERSNDPTQFDQMRPAGASKP